MGHVFPSYLALRTEVRWPHPRRQCVAFTHRFIFVLSLKSLTYKKASGLLLTKVYASQRGELICALKPRFSGLLKAKASAFTVEFPCRFGCCPRLSRLALFSSGRTSTIFQ